MLVLTTVPHPDVGTDHSATFEMLMAINCLKPFFERDNKSIDQFKSYWNEIVHTTRILLYFVSTIQI